MVHVASDYTQPLRWLVPYFGLNVVGVLSLSLLLLTFLLASGVKRDWTLLNLLLVFIVFEWTASTVFMSGTLLAGKEPTFSLALFNGSIIVGSMPAAASAALCVVIRVLSRIISSQGRFVVFADSHALTACLLLGPWVVWLAFIVSSIVVGVRDRALVHKAIFYVTIEQDALNTASAVVCAAFEVAILILEVIATVILVSHWRSFRRLSRAHRQVGGGSGSLSRKARFGDRFKGVNLGLVFRVGFFGILVLFALVVALLTIDDFTSPAGDLAVAAIGPAIFVLFASQDDVLAAWHLRAHRFTSSPHNTSAARGGSGGGGGGSFSKRPANASTLSAHAPAPSEHRVHSQPSTSDLSVDDGLSADGRAGSFAMGGFEDNKSTDHIYPPPERQPQPAEHEAEEVDAFDVNVLDHRAGRASAGKPGRKGVWVHTERQTWLEDGTGAPKEIRHGGR